MGFEELLALVERTALERPEPEANATPTGVPADELDRIAKWRANNRASLTAKAATADDQLEISIIGVIGGGWFGDGISARSIKSLLDQHKNAQSILAIVDSPGGDYFDGVAIMNLFKRHAARVTVEVIGEAASAASVIAMGADEIEMHAGTVMMVHRAWTIGIGNADELRNSASMLDKIDDALGELYATRTGKARDEVDKLVAATTFLTPEEAVGLGFADRVVPAKQKQQPDPAARTARAFASAVAMNTPAPVVALAPPPEPIPPAPVARTNNPVTGKETTMSETENKTNPYASIVASLGLLAGASETDILARIGRLRDLEVQSMAIVGVTDSAQLVGAIRGVKAKADTADKAQTELDQVKAERDKQRFESLLAKGQADRKLTPAEAKHYTDRFNAAVTEARGAESVAELEGYLAVAPRKFAEPASPPPPNGSHANAGAMTWNGKTYAELKPMEKDRLSKEDPELYAQMRRDHRQQPAA